MKNTASAWVPLLWASALVSGCMSAQEHRASVRDDSTDRVTVGKVHREIKVGMSGAQVAEILDSPDRGTGGLRQGYRRNPA